MDSSYMRQKKRKKNKVSALNCPLEKHLCSLNTENLQAIMLLNYIFKLAARDAL